MISKWVIGALVIIGCLVIASLLYPLLFPMPGNHLTGGCYEEALALPASPTAAAPMQMSSGSDYRPPMAPGESFGVYISRYGFVPPASLNCSVATALFVNSSLSNDSATDLFQVIVNTDAPEGRYLCVFDANGHEADFILDVAGEVYNGVRLDPSKVLRCSSGATE